MSSVLIRPMHERDGEAVGAIYAFESVVGYTGQVPLRSNQFWRDFYKSRDPDGLELVGELGGMAVGHLGLIQNHGARRKHVASFGICVHPDHQGKGVGNALMVEMLRQTDNWFNLLRVELAVASNNKPAMALYKKHGFVVEGETRFDIFTAGRFTHTTHMARFHPGPAGEILRAQSVS